MKLILNKSKKTLLWERKTNKNINSINALKFYNSIVGFMLGFINIQNYRDFRENIQILIIIINVKGRKLFL
jgi:hypothetical protein